MILMQVVFVVCCLFNVNKVGYVGMLDLLVMGILLIVLGEVIKIVLFVMEGEKVYWFVVCWGECMDMLDVEGKVVVIFEICLDFVYIEVVLDQFIGDIEQVLLVYFVIKVDGEWVYDLVCDGEMVELEL